MSYRSLLARATEGTDAPTPGYIYIDLAKAATGNPNACQDMAVYLTRRLASKTNPNIKHKCCKVLAKLCDQVPRNGFRRCVAQDHAGVLAIKEAMNFRGTPDPVRGDEPNQKVRTAAKECLEAVYREAPSSEMNAPTGNAGGYGGMSSPQYGAPPHAANGGGGNNYSMQNRMQGIGNPRYQDPRNDPRYNEPVGFSGVVKEAGEVLVGMIKDPLARNIPDVPRHGHSGNLPGYGGPTYGRPPPGAAELSHRTDGQWTMASNRGPGAIQPDYQRDASQQPYGGVSAHSGAVGGSWGNSSSVERPGQSYSTPSVTINSVPGATSGSGGTAVSDGTYEKNLVLELCPAGGMKPVPPPDKLASFARACASLNSDLVCPVLLDCLEEGQPWIIRAKALCAMETAIANGTKLDGTNPYRDFFFACQDEVAPLASHARPAINEPARRVLTLLGVAPGSVPVAAPPVAAAPNLLDFDDEPTTAPPSQPPPSHVPPPPPDAAAAPSQANSMFGGMQVKSSPAPPQPQKQAAPAATPNLLDFDSVASAPAPAQQSNDIFSSSSDATTTAAVQPAVAATTSMFGQLSVKDSEDKKDSDINSVAVNGSSAFGFINETAAPSEHPTQPSFDPLKNHSHHVSPNTAQKKAMQMSPEQMQAMAYQQMMMQQQMQQMQMAMVMQHQMGGATMAGGIPMYPPLGGGVAPMPGGVRRTPSLGSAGAPQLQQFSFAPKPAKKDDKKFDFVKDAMHTAGHKK